MGNTVVFYDEQYPHFCTEEVLQKLMPGGYQLADAAHLAERLSEGSAGESTLFVSFHGPYFPKASWQAIVSFLERGGNLAIFGGMPFARPVNANGEVEPEQDAYSRQVYLGPFFRMSWQQEAVRLQADEDALLLRNCKLTLGEDQDVGVCWSFYPKLTQSQDHPEDTGSAGPFDTVLQPLIYALAPSEVGERRIATPALLLDQRSGRFKGGRWLISAWQPSSEETWLANAEAIRRMITCVSEGATNFTVRPALGCYQPGEMPEVVVTVRTGVEMRARIIVRAAGQPQRDEGELTPIGASLQGAMTPEVPDLSWHPADLSALHVRINPRGATINRAPLEIGYSSIVPNAAVREWEAVFEGTIGQQEGRWSLGTLQEPGLYVIEVAYQREGGEWLAQRSGFWVWDEALVDATYHKRLTAGRDYFYQEGRPFLVYGTTYMDSQVQRKFLQLPNAARWDREMAEMKAAGINLLRTGIWSAWREIVPVAGSINEAFLRALDAFVMTACKHNLQLIFTFFSFSPPMFEGENPWLDPQAIEAQQDFVGALARRYANVELVSWDLINEPSFGDPQKIFAQRPLANYDRFEKTAFRNWLSTRYTLSELQMRWRQTSTDLPDWEHVRPPDAKEYDTYIRSTIARATLQVADYTHFSQEMFRCWAQQMVEAIRAAGGQTLVGVGQDEAGSRLAPQFYAEAVDYTTTHPWWNIDDLLWDMLLDKTVEKPNLIQETGVMQLRDIDGRPWRSEWENAYLLERKLVTGLIARGAGLIQWLWHSNGYMTSDNENSIGLLRADGSAKPELAVMEQFGRMIGALAGRIMEAPAGPDVWVVIPYSQWFVRPDWARFGTQQAIRALGYDLGIIPQMIGEYHLEALATHRPRTVIVPAVQLLSRQAWYHLLAYVHSGGRVLLSGVAGRDQHNMVFEVGVDGMADVAEEPGPVSRYEVLEDSDGQSYQLTFGDEKISYVKKGHNRLHTYQYGAGTLTWCGLPLELANEVPVIAALYRKVIADDVAEQQSDKQSLLRRWDLQDGSKLILVVSEASRARRIALAEGIEIAVEANRAGGVLLERDGSTRAFGGVRIFHP